MDHTNARLAAWSGIMGEQGSFDPAAARAVLAERERSLKPGGPAKRLPQPVNFSQRSANPMRPRWLAEMVGQEKLRSMLTRVVDSAIVNDRPLDHMLLVGSAGTGKSTIANVIGNELCVNVYQVEAPVSHETLLDLRQVMHDRDVLFIDEIHQQSWGDRRGRSTNAAPEVLFSVMEDRTLISDTGVLPFPSITVIGGTTDEGQLSEPFVSRFPLRPVIESYDVRELAQIARHNATAVGMTIHDDAALMFARAARGVPRQVNNYVKNASTLEDGTGIIDVALASEVLFDLNKVTADGLTPDMQNALLFLYRNGRRTSPTQGTIFQASVSNIATGIGKGRDTKAIQLRVEPYLIATGLLQVAPGGRRLTPAGIKRAEQLK